MHRIHTEELSKTEKRAIWDEIIQDFLASNIGLTQYSKQHGLRYDHLSYYVAAYRRKQAGDFIPVVMPPSQTVNSSTKFTIELGKISIAIPANLPPKQLSQMGRYRLPKITRQVHTLSVSDLTCILEGLDLLDAKRYAIA